MSDDPLHQDDPDHRRAVKALHLVEKHSPRSIARLSDNRYRDLEVALVKAFKKISREETPAPARRRVRTVRDGG